MDYGRLLSMAKRREKRVVIDFDGTIAEDAYPDIGDPMPGAKRAIEELAEAGFEIVVFTCRLTLDDERSSAEIKEQRAMVENWLREHDIPFDELYDGRQGKPHASYYIDNKSLNYGGHPGDWEALSKYVIATEGK